MSNARRAPALFGVSALLVLGGTSVMAGTIEQGQPFALASQSSVATVDRSAAILRADRAYADRLARAARAQQLADQRRAAAAKAHKAHLIAVANAKARKAAAAKKAAAVEAAAKARKAAAARAARTSVRSTAPFTGSNRTIGRKMAAARGWTGDQWVCLNNLWTAESGWRHKAGNPSGAYGIPQALPGTKMASAGADWRTNPATQIKWGLNYIDGRYGTPCSAWRHFQAKRWY